MYNRYVKSDITSFVKKKKKKSLPQTKKLTKMYSKFSELSYNENIIYLCNALILTFFKIHFRMKGRNFVYIFFLWDV